MLTKTLTLATLLAFNAASDLTRLLRRRCAVSRDNDAEGP